MARKRSEGPPRQMNRQDLADKLRSRREELRRTQAEVGKAAGVGQPTISKYETGERLPERDVIVPYARALELEPAELLSWMYDLAQEELSDLEAEKDTVLARLEVMNASVDELHQMMGLLSARLDGVIDALGGPPVAGQPAPPGGPGASRARRRGKA